MLLGVSAEGGALSPCDGVEGPREEIFGFFLGGIFAYKLGIENDSQDRGRRKRGDYNPLVKL